MVTKKRVLLLVMGFIVISLCVSTVVAADSADNIVDNTTIQQNDLKSIDSTLTNTDALQKSKTVDNTKTATGNTYYVATNGKSSNSGTENSPFDLETGVTTLQSNKNGNLIVNGGTYKLSETIKFYEGTYSVAGKSGQNVIFDAQNKFRHLYLGTNSNVEIKNIVFVNGNGIDYGNIGGAIKAESGGKKVITNNIFTTNYAPQYGGAISTAADNTEITNNIFTSNVAGVSGGAICTTAKNTKITGNTFTQNSGARNGGAVYTSGSGTMIQNNKFIKNLSNLTAAAIYNTGASVTVEKNVFQQNTAYRTGGAIYDDSTGIKILNNEFTANTVKLNGNVGDGAAAYIRGTKATVQGNTFTDNTAAGSGGAVYLDSGGQATVTKNVFTTNKASNYGGALYSRGSGNIITNNTFVMNIDPNSKRTAIVNIGTNATISNNKNADTTKYYGSICNSGNSVTITGNVFDEGEVTHIYIYERSGDLKNTTIKVSGKLLINDTGLKGETIIIKVNNKNYTAVTGGYGYFTVNHTIDSYDDLNVTFTYTGNATYLPSANSTVYSVKKPTYLYMYPRNGDKKDSTIKVSGKLQSNGEEIKGETILITVNNKNYTAVTGGYGYFTVNHTITNYDDCNVTFKYLGSSNYLSTINTTVYPVKKPTNIFMYSRSGDVKGSTIKVSGKLQTDGEGIKGETVTISVNGRRYSAISGGYGYFTVNYTIDSYDDLNVTFEYDGGSKYLSTKNSTVYSVKKPTNLFMYSRSGDTKGSTIKVSGKLQSNGEGIKGETVYITVNEKNYTAISGGYGYFTVNHTITDYNDLNVTFKYVGSNKYISSNNKTIYSVKKPTNLYMYTRNGDTKDSTIKVSGKLQSNGEGIKGETVYITVNEKNYTAISGGYGYFTVNHTITDYNDLNVTFKYVGSNKYISSNNKTIYSVKKPTNLYMYTRNGDTKDSTIKVSGKLLYNDTGIKGETITIKVNDKTYTATTGGYGYFTTNHTITGYDNLNVTFEYKGSPQYLSTKNSTIYSVKKPTNLYMYTRNGDTKDSTIKVSGKLLYNDTGIKGETITIKVNDKTYTAKTGGYGYFTINHTITSYDDCKVTFEYGGSSNYLSSKNTTTYFVKKPITLFMYEKGNITNGTTTKISGKLLYNDTGIKGETITIYVNSKKYTATTGGYGYFTINHTVDTPGTNIVKFVFAGTSKYLSSNNITTFYVPMISTKITVENVDDIQYSNYACINGYYTDINNHAIKNASVNITINGNSQYIYTNDYGEFTLYHETDKIGTNNVTITCSGVMGYNSSTTKMTFNVMKKLTKIGLYVYDTEYLGANLIQGSLFGTLNAVNRTISLLINGEENYIKTYDDGSFSYTYKPNKIGLTTITATYIGDTEYYESSITKTIYVNPTNTFIELMDIYEAQRLGYPIITGNLSYYYPGPLTYTTLNINIDGINYNTKTDGEGHFSYDYPGNIDDIDFITVSYPGNEKFVGTSKTIKTGCLDTEIIINLRRDPMMYGYGFNSKESLKGSVRGSDGIYLTNVPLTLTLNGKSVTVYSDDNGDFNYYTCMTEPGVNNLTVTYNGDDKHSPTTTKAIFEVFKKTVYLTIIDTAQSVDGESIKIQGRLYDNEGYMLPNMPIILKIDDKIYKTQTDNNGTYIYYYKNNTKSIHRLSVIFEGTSLYNSEQTDITFVPHKENEIEIKIVKHNDKNDSILFKDVNAIRNMGTDIIKGWYQKPTGESGNSGVYVMMDNTLRISSNILDSVVFYYKNYKTGDIINITGEVFENNTAYAENINDYVPYKAVVKYNVRPSQNITDTLYSEYHQWDFS